MNTDKKSEAYLTFLLGDEKFAVLVNYVHEVVELNNYTRVPDAPAYMLGIFNLRGTILPLLDTRIKLGLPQKEKTNKTRILILNVRDKEDATTSIGAIVDVAREVVEIEDENIQKPDDIEGFKSTTPVTGIVNDHGDITMIMDIHRVFSVDELSHMNKTIN
ncbi:purine-binding chemotaxis protein CheW [Fulvivirga sp. 29W222]|uniref:Purine-binding chemotaxis protein CheW n=1 Tax=Fulvivirga marina TaxID=2494733 RepID=A0A937KGK4_9BACT|nr:chemotaxis protein CheW [Fulvivirga marina]MBL6449283.1 purine-binding chemotaxis protein CheW [Fulvivirga marina]